MVTWTSVVVVSNLEWAANESLKTCRFSRMQLFAALPCQIDATPAQLSLRMPSSRRGNLDDARTLASQVLAQTAFSSVGGLQLTPHRRSVHYYVEKINFPNLPQIPHGGETHGKHVLY